MTLVDRSKLNQLIDGKENNRVDFKIKYNLNNNNNKKELAYDVCSIANYLFLNGGVGHLIIGIEDKNYNLIGICLDDYLEERLQQIICSYSDPPPEFSIEYFNLDNKWFLNINIEKSMNGPHQVKRLGFPIRRGPTNDLMLTSEVIHAIEIKNNDLKLENNEYEILSKEIKGGKVMQDTSDCLNKLEFINIRNIFYPGEDFENIISYECNLIVANKNIGLKKYDFYLTFQENGNEKGLFKTYYSMEGFSKSIDKNNSIFLHLIEGSLSNSFFFKIIKDESLAQNKISNSIRYLGLGIGTEDRIMYKNSFYLPKIYIANVKSKKDILKKLEISLNWLQDNTKILNMVQYLQF